jgi:hypothetical protein
MFYDHGYMNRITVEEDLALLSNSQADMAAVHDGAAMEHAARAIIERLRGETAVTFVGSSVEGLALAATCSALWGHDGHWVHWKPGRPAPPIAGSVVLVEPTAPGSGWKTLLADALPGARLIVGPAFDSVDLVAPA